MPNHVINEIIFRGIGSLKRVDILNAVMGESAIDFEVLLPSPLNIWPGNVSQKHEKAFPGTHLDWARDNWGTKWNAYGLDKGYQSIEYDDDTLTLRFQTAWSPPMGWIVALFNKFKISFDHNYLDEGAIRGVCARFDYPALLNQGDGWSERDANEEEQRYLHKLLWGVESFDEEVA